MFTKKLGFTILELLVVIAIIAILSSLTLYMISNSRAKAKIASVQSTVGTILPIATSCVDEGEILNIMTDTQTGGGLICDNNLPEWPALANGWEYGDEITSNVVTSTFSFEVHDENGNSILCNDSDGCVTTLAL